MKKKSLTLLFTVFALVTLLLPVTAYATLADDASPYEYGETYTGTISSYHKVFYLKLNYKSNIYIKLNYKAFCELSLYNSNGTVAVKSEDFIENKNNATGMYTYTCTRILPKGTYYLEIYPDWDRNINARYTFFATAEKAITLSRPKITSLTNSAKKSMAVKIASVSNRTGYEIQYATNSKFTNAKTVKSKYSKTISGLTKGKTYYVRVRAYAIYGAGNKVYSPWSIVQYTKISK